MSYSFEKFCKKCGAAMDDNATYCPKCGIKQDEDISKSSTDNNHINKSSGVNTRWLITLLLCFFAGSLGIHRFYNGKIVTGILMLITLGGLGFWSIIDLIIIVVGNFKDKYGNKISVQ
ncbi:MAG: TM2 domain-containing protein [Bacteroidales bacterium]